MITAQQATAIRRNRSVFLCDVSYKMHPSKEVYVCLCVCRQKATLWHMAGEQRKHLSLIFMMPQPRCYTRGFYYSRSSSPLHPFIFCSEKLECCEKLFHITEEEFWLTFLCRTVLIRPQWRILVFGLSRGGLANVFFQIKILLHSLSVLEQ